LTEPSRKEDVVITAIDDREATPSPPSALVTRARAALRAMDLSELPALGFQIDNLEYEFVFQYPPPALLEPTTPEAVFGGERGDGGGPRRPARRGFGIYIHIPFCSGICTYCHYVKVQLLKSPGFTLPERYLSALCREIDLVFRRESMEGSVATSIHLGGGTPTTLTDDQLGRLFDALFARIELLPGSEFNCESAPETLMPKEGGREKLAFLRDRGVNRLNIGIQAFEDHLLLTLRRRHTAEIARRSILEAQDAGIPHINIDLMYGLADQTLRDWEHTLEETAALRPSSVSLYHLRVHPQAPYAEKVDPSRLPPEEQALTMYLMAVDRLKAAGYIMNINNKFVLGAEHVHRQVTDKFQSGELLGVGVSSYGHINNFIYVNARSMRDYMEALEAGRLPTWVGRELSRAEAMARRMVLGVKVEVGVDRARFARDFGCPPEEAFGPTLARLGRLRMIETVDDRIRLTPRGLLYADEICTEFYTPEDQARLEAAGGTRYGALFNRKAEALF
jgi:oxygen-independent coproporphyrinogen III oxidase